MKILEQGTQIAYVPPHAQIRTDRGHRRTWDVNHPDVKFGFVTSQRGDTVFCRYWHKGRPGELQTVANSEGTPADCLVLHKSVSDRIVKRALQGIEARP